MRSRDEFSGHRQSYSWPFTVNYITEVSECKNGGLQFALVEHIQGAQHLL
jgi:hypothetical protein